MAAQGTALALALMLPAAEVASQMNPLRELELTAQDMELLGATANRLYDAGEIGASATWSNAA